MFYTENGIVLIMSVLKDLISLNIFVLSLIVLYQTTDHLLALLIVIAITTVYIIKHFKLNNYLKKELQSQVEIFETLFNYSTDVILYLDLNMNIIACNDTLSKTFSIPKEESIGHSVHYVLENNIKDEQRRIKIKKNVERNIQRAIKTKQSVQFCEKFYIGSQDTGYFNILISPAFSSNNDIRGTIIIARNITAEHNAVMEAQEKEAQLKCLLENMPICAYMKDKDDHFVIGSSSFEKVINCEDEDVKQLVLSDVFDQKYLNFVKKEEAEVYRTRKPIETERQVVFPNQTFWGRVRKAPVFDENGAVKYMIVMYENIESEKEMQRQKEYFIETLIHDLKNPTLAQLRGLELLQNEALGAITLEQKELIEQIGGSCKYILNMISMVLNTYRLENGKSCLVYEKFNISELLTECFDEISYLTKEKALTFIYDASEAGIDLDADRGAIKTVIINLLSNAIIYSGKNEQIDVKITSDNNQLKFKIISKGITLSDRECSTMFDRSCGDTPKYSTIGNGISLYLCKKIVDVHNGQIYAYTDGEKTNTFTFIIPQYRNELVSAATSPLFI